MVNVNFSSQEFMEENNEFILDLAEKLAERLISQLSSNHEKELASNLKTNIVISCSPLFKYVVADIIEEIEDIEEE